MTRSSVAPAPLLILTVPLLPIEKLLKSMMPRWLDCVIVSVSPCVPIEPMPATKCPPCGSMFAGTATGEPACAAEAAARSEGLRAPCSPRGLRGSADGNQVGPCRSHAPPLARTRPPRGKPHQNDEST